MPGEVVQQSVEHLAAKELGEDGDGEEEAGVVVALALLVEGESAGGDNGVDVGMESQISRPGVHVRHGKGGAGDGRLRKCAARAA